MQVEARETQSKWLQYLCNQLNLLVVVLGEHSRVQMDTIPPETPGANLTRGKGEVDKPQVQFLQPPLLPRSFTDIPGEVSSPRDFKKTTTKSLLGFIPQYRNQNIMIFFSTKGKM
uniref:Uncharacterized protein n=1 Tax=Micrurus lemniscatus lemniscatus TaxID=129467 RepID=A0A2D4HD37_MICLE